jgi:signal transduction histidine kinase
METISTWERLRRVNTFVWDGLFAVGIMVVSLAAGASFNATSGRSGWIRLNVGPLGALIVAAASLALIWRRRAPFAVLVVIAALAAAYGLLGYHDGLVGFPLVIATYTVAAHRPRGGVLTASALVALSAWLVLLILGPDEPGPLEIVLDLVAVVVLPFLIGRIAWNRRRRIDRDRERAALDAVAEERARISRELHDVVAHAMGVMVVQAGAARTVLTNNPGSAARALERIEDTGRTGIAEMRRLLGIYAADGDAARDPQPGLARLDELLDTMRGAGLPVEVVTEGEVRPLPPGIDLILYRVVQESLTNTLKHGGDARARVVIRYEPDAMEVEVADDGRGPLPATAQAPAGHGLIGMRERAALYAGSLDAGARPGGGFLVRARIPEDGSA